MKHSGGVQLAHLTSFRAQLLFLTLVRPLVPHAIDLPWSHLASIAYGRQMPFCSQELSRYIFKCPFALSVGFSDPTEASNLKPWRV